MTPNLLIFGDFCVEGDVIPSISSELEQVMHSSDAVSVNFEGPIRCDAETYPKMGPALDQNPLVVSLLASWGVNLFCLANNHIMDYGLEGLEYTLTSLHGFLTLGASDSFNEAYRNKVVKVGEYSIAMLAFSEAQFGAYTDEDAYGRAGGYAWVGHPMARKAVVDACLKADYVVVQIHAGLEMVDLPLPEWRTCYREFIDLGADLVVGHHPHVVQGCEQYCGKHIYYSTGNFYMDRMVENNKIQGGFVEVEITENGLKSAFIPLKITRDVIGIDNSEYSLKEFERKSSILTNNADYLNRIDTKCEEYWSLYYSKYYAGAFNGVGFNWDLEGGLQFIKRLIKKIVSLSSDSSKQSALMVIHNTKIETHRWAAERALINRCSMK